MARRPAGLKAVAAAFVAGELDLDALSWSQIDFDAGVIAVNVQWNVKTRSFTEPKYGPYTIALVDHAEQGVRDPSG